MNKTLQNAVIRQLGGRDLLQDLANYGAASGFGRFIYYVDTVAFFKRRRKNICALVQETAKEFGQSPIDFVASFNCLKTSDRAERLELEAEIGRALYGRLQPDDFLVPNALSWFAAETVARELTK